MVSRAMTVNARSTDSDAGGINPKEEKGRQAQASYKQAHDKLHDAMRGLSLSLKAFACSGGAGKIGSDGPAPRESASDLAVEILAGRIDARGQARKDVTHFAKKQKEYETYRRDNAAIQLPSVNELSEQCWRERSGSLPMVASLRAAVRAPDSKDSWDLKGRLAPQLEQVRAALTTSMTSYLEGHQSAFSLSVSQIEHKAKRMEQLNALDAALYNEAGDIVAALPYLSASERKAVKPLLPSVFLAILRSSNRIENDDLAYTVFWGNKYLSCCQKQGIIPQYADLWLVLRVISQAAPLTKGELPRQTLRMWNFLVEVLSLDGESEDTLVKVFPIELRDEFLGELRKVEATIIALSSYFPETPVRRMGEAAQREAQDDFFVPVERNGVSYQNYWPKPELFSVIEKQVMQAMAAEDRTKINNYVVQTQPGAGKSEAINALVANLAHKSREENWPKKVWACRPSVNMLISSTYGESAKIIYSLFERADRFARDKNAIVVILLDEVQSLLADDRSQTSHEDRRVVTAFLDNLDRSRLSPGVLVLACTNDASILNPAARSRLTPLSYDTPWSVFDDMAGAALRGLGCDDLILFDGLKFPGACVGGEAAIDGSSSFKPGKALDVQEIVGAALSLTNPRCAQSFCNMAAQRHPEQLNNLATATYHLLRAVAEGLENNPDEVRKNPLVVRSLDSDDGAGTKVLAAKITQENLVRRSAGGLANGAVPAEILHLFAHPTQPLVLVGFIQGGLNPNFLWLSNRDVLFPNLALAISGQAATFHGEEEKKFERPYRFFYFPLADELVAQEKEVAYRVTLGPFRPQSSGDQERRQFLTFAQTRRKAVLKEQ